MHNQIELRACEQFCERPHAHENDTRPRNDASDFEVITATNNGGKNNHSSNGGKNSTNTTFIYQELAALFARVSSA